LESRKPGIGISQPQNQKSRADEVHLSGFETPAVASHPLRLAFNFSSPLLHGLRIDLCLMPAIEYRSQQLMNA
jgi:hypothetical protein